MTTGIDILTDGLGRIRELSARVAAGLTEHQLTARIDPESNTIAWLLWHIGRGQDAQVADVAGTGQVWTDDGWHERFGLPFDVSATGYAHGADDVAAVSGVSVDLFAGYIDAVCERSEAYLATLDETDLDRIVDERWTPAVTLAARLFSVISDDLQHAGQAAFIRGVIERR